MRNCFIDKETRSIADLTNLDEMVPGTMTITRINVPEASRGKGWGTFMLEQILHEADTEGVALSLEIMPSGPLNYEALESWYMRHGFKHHPKYPSLYIRKPIVQS